MTNTTAYCANNFEGWGGYLTGPYCREHEYIQQVRYLSPMGEAFVDLVRNGQPIWLVRAALPSVRALALEEECRATLERRRERLEARTEDAMAPPKTRRL